jgi:hypothetical protein
MSPARSSWHPLSVEDAREVTAAGGCILDRCYWVQIISVAILLPDGCLVHLGRKDLQVKVRGQRVEVAEVEGALLRLNGVQEAMVMTREDGRGLARAVRDGNCQRRRRSKVRKRWVRRSSYTGKPWHVTWRSRTMTSIFSRMLQPLISPNSRIFADRKAAAASLKSPPPLVDQDLALTRVETPRVWGVPCPHASRRCPP